MAEAILIQNILGSTVAVTIADAVVTSNNIKSTIFNNVKVTTNVNIVTTGTSTAQQVNLKLKLNGATLNTWVFRSTATIQQFPLSLIYIGNHTQAGGLAAGGVLSLTASGAGNDAQTTVTCTSTYVESVDT